MAKVTVETVLDLARTEIDTQATNYKQCKYNTAFYGYVVSASWADWCAAFIWWIFNKAGAADLLFVKTAGCGVLAQAFYNRGKFHTSGYKAGDIVFFHWSNAISESVPITYTLDHVGIIEKVNADGSYTTIEGNTGGGNGAVKRMTRYAYQISGVARPDYAGGSTVTTVQVTQTKPSVATVQNWLNTNYKTDLTVDGIYGGKTQLALVKALQAELNKQYGAKLAVDGIFGAKTSSAIRNLQLGSQGNLTRILQGMLLCNGYTAGGFDGIFGTGTKSAVVSFQYKYGLVTDGIAGKATFAELCG